MARTRTPAAPREKTYTVLSEIRSESGSWTYEIRMSHKDGTRYCTCPGFFMHGRNCRHMRAFLGETPSAASRLLERFRPVPLVNRPAARVLPSATALLIRDALAATFPHRTCESLTAHDLNALAKRVEAHVLKARGLGQLAPAVDTTPNFEPADPRLNAEGVRVITLPDTD